MSFTHEQVNQLKRIVRAVGLDPADWSQTRWAQLPKPFPNNGSFEVFTDGYWFFGIKFPDSSGPWPYCCSPGPVTPLLNGQAKDWEQLLSEAEKWATAVAAQKPVRKSLLELYPELDKTRAVLLPSEQAEIVRVIKDYYFRGEITWSGSDHLAMMQVSEGGFQFLINTNSSAVSCRPGEYKSEATFDKVGRKRWLELARDWGSWVRRDQKAMQERVEALRTPAGKEPVYLKHLKLEGIRGFKDFSLPFDAEVGCRMQTIVIGPNGTGKSTLLRSIALSLAPSSEIPVLLTSSLAGFLPEDGEARIVVGFSNDTAREILIERRKGQELLRSVTGTEPEGVFVYGAGAGRSHESSQALPADEYRVSLAVQSLFNYATSMASVELTLRRMRDLLKSNFDSCLAEWILKVRGREGSTFELPSKGGVIVREREGREFPFTQWADGYRLTFSWMMDAFSWAMLHGQVDPLGMRGILLVDELETHLHPQLQQTLLTRLRELFPSLQLIGSTHGPMTALGCGPGELAVLTKTDAGIVALRGRETFVSVEEILEDDRGFETRPYDEETSTLLERYESLATIVERSAAENAELAELAKSLEKRLNIDD